MMRKIDYLVVHCTATPQSTTIDSIIQYWQKVLGWKNNGYHIVIDTSGKIHRITPLEKIANGVKNHNSNSIHIAYIGGVDRNNKPIDNRTYAQKQSLIYILRELLQKFPEAKILGHKDFKGVAKDCPCFNAKIEYQNILDLFG